jgi:hypothetical protein
MTKNPGILQLVFWRAGPPQVEYLILIKNTTALFDANRAVFG